VTVADAPDPLDVLEKLLGSEGKEAAGLAKPETNGDNTAEEDFELELDFEELSLREFASQESPYAKKEHVYTAQTVEECMYCPVYFVREDANVTWQSNATKRSLKISIDQYVPAMTC
jgi:hypothetical protein